MWCRWNGKCCYRCRCCCCCRCVYFFLLQLVCRVAKRNEFCNQSFLYLTIPPITMETTSRTFIFMQKTFLCKIKKNYTYFRVKIRHEFLICSKSGIAMSNCRQIIFFFSTMLLLSFFLAFVQKFMSGFGSVHGIFCLHSTEYQRWQQKKNMHKANFEIQNSRVARLVPITEEIGQVFDVCDLYDHHTLCAPLLNMVF